MHNNYFESVSSPSLSESAYNPDGSLGDSPWQLQLSIHSPQQSLVIIYECCNRSFWVGIASTAAVELVQTLHTGKTAKEVAITIVCIHALTEG